MQRVYFSLMASHLSLMTSENSEIPPPWLVIFAIVSFYKIPLFSKDLVTSMIYFISLFVRVIPEALLDVNFWLSSFMLLLT